MKGRQCVMTNRRTHEEHVFPSIAEAAAWLGRDPFYLRTAYTNATTVCRFVGGDTYDIDIRGKKKEMPAIASKPKQLCFDCKKAVGGCSWSRTYTPVDGWTAEPTMIKQDGKMGRLGRANNGIPSYQITQCPQFERG